MKCQWSAVKVKGNVWHRWHGCTLSSGDFFAAPPSIEMKARLSGAHPGNTLSNSVTTQANPHGNLNGCTVAKGLKVGFERSAWRFSLLHSAHFRDKLRHKQVVSWIRCWTRRCCEPLRGDAGFYICWQDVWLPVRARNLWLAGMHVALQTLKGFSCQHGKTHNHCDHYEQISNERLRI